MPGPSTGTLVNAQAFLSAFGEDVVLADGSVVQGIFSFPDDFEWNPEGGRADIDSRYTLDIPVVLAGTLAVEQAVAIRGRGYFVRALASDEDGWYLAILETGRDTPIPTPHIMMREFGPGFSRAFA